MITVRMIETSDIQGLMPLIAQLGYPATIEQLKKRYELFMSLDGYGLAVACDQTQVIGFVVWSKSVLFVSDAARMRVEGLIVDEKYRGQGVGKKLMMFLEEFAKKFSPVIIDLTSGLRRAQDGSHEFYKRLGYENEGPMAKVYFRKFLIKEDT